MVLINVIFAETNKEYDFKAMSTTTTENAKKVAKYVLKSISAE